MAKYKIEKFDFDFGKDEDEEKQEIVVKLDSAEEIVVKSVHAGRIITKSPKNPKGAGRAKFSESNTTVIKELLNTNKDFAEKILEAEFQEEKDELINELSEEEYETLLEEQDDEEDITNIEEEAEEDTEEERPELVDPDIERLKILTGNAEQPKKHKGAPKGNTNSSREMRMAAALRSATSVYIDDMVNTQRKNRFTVFFNKVQTKELDLNTVSALLHMMVSEENRKIAKNRDTKLIIDCSAQIRLIEETKLKIEAHALALKRDKLIMGLFAEWADIIRANVRDVALCSSILKQMREALNKKIDTGAVTKIAK